MPIVRVHTKADQYGTYIHITAESLVTDLLFLDH